MIILCYLLTYLSITNVIPTSFSSTVHLSRSILMILMSTNYLVMPIDELADKGKRFVYLFTTKNDSKCDSLATVIVFWLIKVQEKKNKLNLIFHIHVAWVIRDIFSVKSYFFNTFFLKYVYLKKFIVHNSYSDYLFKIKC